MSRLQAVTISMSWLLVIRSGDIVPQFGSPTAQLL
jgi:hypothetical protein